MKASLAFFLASGSSLRFFVGDLVSSYTETVSIGGTSITVRVTVEATRAKSPHENVCVTQAEVVYVAIDEAGKSVPVRL